MLPESAFSHQVARYLLLLDLFQLFAAASSVSVLLALAVPRLVRCSWVQGLYSSTDVDNLLEPHLICFGITPWVSHILSICEL